MNRVEAKSWGEIEAPPEGCRWGFPFSRMQPGDSFRVDQLAKTKGQLANQVYVAGSRLDKKFSVTDDPDHPGFTLVRCRAEEEEMVQPVATRSVLSYEEAGKLFERFYGLDHAETIRQFAGILPAGSRHRVMAGWLERPPLDSIVVKASFNPCPTLVELGDGEVKMTGMPEGFSLEAWKAEQLLAD